MCTGGWSGRFWRSGSAPADGVVGPDEVGGEGDGEEELLFGDVEVEGGFVVVDEETPVSGIEGEEGIVAGAQHLRGEGFFPELEARVEPAVVDGGGGDAGRVAGNL